MTVVIPAPVVVDGVEVETVLLVPPVRLAGGPDELSYWAETIAPHPVTFTLLVSSSTPPVFLLQSNSLQILAHRRQLSLGLHLDWNINSQELNWLITFLSEQSKFLCKTLCSPSTPSARTPLHALPDSPDLSPPPSQEDKRYISTPSSKQSTTRQSSPTSSRMTNRN